MIVRVLEESVKSAQSARSAFYCCLFENMMSLLTKTAHLDMLCLIVPKVLLTRKKENALSVVMFWRRGTVVLLALLAMVVAACGGAQDTQQAPSFTLTGASGEQVSLSDYVGNQPVLLYFHMAVG